MSFRVLCIHGECVLKPRKSRLTFSLPSSQENICRDKEKISVLSKMKENMGLQSQSFPTNSIKIRQFYQFVIRNAISAVTRGDDLLSELTLHIWVLRE